jgi:ABC-2 type transport system permease protein
VSTMWLVARRELATRGRTRSFVLGLAISAVLMAGLAVLPRVVGGETSYTVGLAGASAERLRPVLVAQAAADDIDLDLRSLPDEPAARAAVEDGEVDAAVVDDRLLYRGELDSGLAQLLQTAHRTVAVEQRLRLAGIDPRQVEQALAAPPLEEVGVGDASEHGSARRVLAMVVVILMFMLIYLPALYVAMGVVEEKSSRVVELLLATIRPWQLLAGKIIGIGLLGLVQLAVIAAVGVGAAAVTGVLSDLPPGLGSVVAGTFVWFLLGYAFFSAAAAASGALVSRQEEVNGVMTPLSVVVMAGYVVGFSAAFNPGTPVASVLSVVPPFSAVVMPVRVASSTVPAWQVAVALVLMALATVAVVALGARIYQRAVLRTGARVRLREVLRLGAAG